MTTRLPVLVMRLLGPGFVEAVVELVQAPDDDLAGVAEELPDHVQAQAQGVGLDGAVYQPQLVLGCRVCMSLSSEGIQLSRVGEKFLI